jgi:hypothetical protein
MAYFLFHQNAILDLPQRLKCRFFHFFRVKNSLKYAGLLFLAKIFSVHTVNLVLVGPIEKSDQSDLSYSRFLNLGDFF